MCSNVLLEVILPAKPFTAGGAGVRPDAAVDELVSGEFFISCKGLIATRLVAGEGPFASVDTDVVLELAVV